MKQTRNLEDLLRQYDLLAAPAARDAAVTGICNDSRRALSLIHISEPTRH